MGMTLPEDPVIPLLGIYPAESPAYNKDKCFTMFIAAFFIIARSWKELLAIINKAAMNMVEHVSLLHVGACAGYMPRSGIAGFSGSTMYNFLRKG